MNFEVLKRSNLKRNIIIGVVVVAIITAVVITFSRASYKSVAKVDLVDGVINYVPYDFKVIAMYQKDADDDDYEEVDTMPDASSYVINTSESYCTVDGNSKDENAVLETIDGHHTIAGLQTGSKCYLYFDEVEAESAKDYILAYAEEGSGTPNFANTSCSNGNCQEETVGLYEMEVNNATTYYFRGDVEDNYVKFAGFYWRIIRINEDGSIRLIYDGTEAYANGNGDDGDYRQITTTSDFTSIYNSVATESYYVGYTYTVNQQRPSSTTSGTNSIIKNELETWYNSNLYSEYDSYITSDPGFCNDRTSYFYSSGEYTEGWNVSGSSVYYGAYVRLRANKTPTLECDEGDLYKTKVGLITADEVAMAGGVYFTISSSCYNRYYYLYTGNEFWTMSPSEWTGSARVFTVSSTGDLYGKYVSLDWGVRPVINLRSDVTISSGDGSSENPFVVST